ncbi:hypothetical protein HBH53_107760 [Parastagonospora nodorum]|nr:hypothetical protein HBH53_107760 [Parastagonospora nodorum]KAH3970813.1 hypothetical protein HBH52_163740 [Parastagonospora nodorum]KAH4065178.1 hypothetical protein HBH50_163030 [Parastagonospora nodorum]KAH4084577.1 hypothetical protein HBH48_160760 [Parastagonospora nodorum]KAH4101711.1 hypothetical protein HBH46_135970 [Parastagonospora nodorum]
MPGLMGNSKWGPGGEHDNDDDNDFNRDNRRNNRRNNYRAPPGPKATGNRKNNASPHQDNSQNWKKGKTPAPAYGTRALYVVLVCSMKNMTKGKNYLDVKCGVHITT